MHEINIIIIAKMFLGKMPYNKRGLTLVCYAVFQVAASEEVPHVPLSLLIAVYPHYTNTHHTIQDTKLIIYKSFAE